MVVMRCNLSQNFCCEKFAVRPHPVRLSAHIEALPLPKLGEGSNGSVPLLPKWEKGLGDEGLNHCVSALFA